MGDLDRVTPGQQHRILGTSTLALTVCFAVWTIFSIIGVQITQDLALNDTEFGLLVATPILTGSLSRIVLGIWTDQYGGRLVFTLLMVAAAARSPSVSRTCRAGVPRSGRARRSACSASATSARR